MPHADDPQELSVPTFGCVGSKIPDRKPPARLAQPKYDQLQPNGFPQLQLLSQTIRSTMFSSGRFPKSLTERSDFIENLVEEGVNLGTALLDKSDAEIVTGAKSIARKLIHREKKEVRWTETVDGKQIRKSRAEIRIQHPVERVDEKTEWVTPVDALEVDANGKLLGVTAQNINEVEARMIEQIYQLRLQSSVIGLIGVENWRWATEYTTRKGDGSLTNADHQLFKRLKEKVREVIQKD